jgi:hypothetical protein
MTGAGRKQVQIDIKLEAESRSSIIIHQLMMSPDHFAGPASQFTSRCCIVNRKVSNGHE